MKRKPPNPYADRQRRFSYFLRALRFIFLPLVIHLVFTAIFAIDDDRPWSVLLSALISSAFAGGLMAKAGHGPVESALLSAWPAVAGSWREWYWATGINAPGNPARDLVRWFGWPDASATAAVAVVAVAAGAAGWFYQHTRMRR